MMFEIIWTDDAFEQMEAFVSARLDLRYRFAAGLWAANHSLSSTPEIVGESRDASNRVAFFDCLTIHFEINADDKIVIVSHVHLSPNSI